MNLKDAIRATELSEEKVYCEIDPETREISVPETYKIIGVESDEDVERVWFKCPKVVGDNIDLSKYQLRVNYQNANSDKGQYIITDVKIDGDNIIFSWLLGRLVTAYVGKISFIICAVNVSSSDIKNEWNTTLAQAQVLTGLEVEPQDLPTTGDDLINQLKSITAQTQTFANTAQAASKSAQDNADKVQQQADRVEDILENVPDFNEYDTLAQLEKSFHEGRKYNGMTYAGKTSDKGVKLHSVKGKTVQQTTNGYQLFDASKIATKTSGGTTVTNNGDGSFTISGSGSLTEPFTLEYTMDDISFLKLGKLTLSGLSTIHPAFQVIGYNTNKYSDRTFVLSTSGIEVNITSEILENTKGIYCVFYGNVNDTIKTGTIKPMLYQDGDGTWEPYTGGKPAPNPDYPMEIQNVEITEINAHGKQLFDASKIPTKSQGGATLTNNKDGSFTLTGSGHLSEGFNAYYYVGNADFLKKGLLKLNLNGSMSLLLQIIGLSVKGNQAIENRTFTITNNGTAEITDELLRSTVDVMVTFYGINGLSITSGTVKPMLYQDGEGTWEPFHMDTIETSLTLAEGDVYEDGVVTRSRKKIICDGSNDESWGLQSINEYGIANFWVYDNGIKTSSLGKSNRFKRQTSSISVTQEEGFSLSIGTLYIRINNETASTVKDFRTWLQTHNLIVEYELAAPTTEELKIPTVPSYFPYTDVSTDNELETDMTWKVLADCDNSLKQEALEKRIEALEQNALGE